MTAQTVFTMINPQTKTLGLQVYNFEDDSYFRELKNYNYYSIVLVTKGNGEVTAGQSNYNFQSHGLLCFSIYEPLRIKAMGEFEGLLINFHPDFFCIHNHQQEVGCNGVLFNNIYGSPVILLTEEEFVLLAGIATQLTNALQQTGVAQYELLISYLKILLINASRLKILQQQPELLKQPKEPFLLKTLKDVIEEHYRNKHRPADYADMLNISAKSLNRLSKSHFNKTLSSLINERIIIEAKRELYLTAKSVKLIAYELGFSDEFYFSRFFKTNVSVSPLTYRETVGFDRESV